ncbi:MAG: hypothetical protein HYU66_22445 [Armatimonadetes bacterium]|nr:hypothetical protein [Armatimonadota bacterium]
MDEPVGARDSLGLTLWHLGHNARYVEDFHAWLRARGTPAEDLVKSLRPPPSTHAVLLEPELIAAPQPGGWVAEGPYLASGAGDQGPTVSFPLSVPATGCYRLWVRYYGWPTGTGVTRLRLYAKGSEAQAPIVDDEVYDQATATEGPQWHDLLVDLRAGEYVVRLGHVTRWWHAGKGPNGYLPRRIDCLYLTERLWDAPPADDARAALRAQGGRGPLWTVQQPLPPRDSALWRRWQIRPVAWEQRDAQSKLFALSQAFWRDTVARLSRQEYQEDAPPDYRVDERQVVFDETWNLVSNPVRARRQTTVLQADIHRTPLPYHYVWHDVAGNIPGLAATDRPKSYGDWTASQGCLFASYGSPSGTVGTEVPVAHAGRYHAWVLSSSTNLSYTAPWFGTASVDGKEQFRYHHEGKIPGIWMKMGEVELTKPGSVRVDFTLDGAGAGGTYRRIYTLFLVDDAAFVPQGTVRPPWTLEMYRERAAQAGGRPGDRYLSWVFDQPYTPLSQEVWADRTTAGRSWPEQRVGGPTAVKHLAMARDSVRAVQIGLRNLADQPLTLAVLPGPLQAGRRASPGRVEWRAVAFAPGGADRQSWTPFFLLRRPRITVPPLNVAGVWLTIDGHGVPPGEYVSVVTLSARGLADHTVTLKLHVSPVAASPRQPVLVDGYTQPHEGEAYLRDYVAHGLKVWRGEMTKADMRRWGIRLLALYCAGAADLERIKALGVDYQDWFVVIMDEPSGDTEEKLKPYLEAAKALRALDPQIRISFNPGEAGSLATFQLLAPYCDFWLPYSLHLSEHWGGPEKWAIYKAKPWMWYTTPCLWDKSPSLPESISAQIRQVPAQTGLCVGPAFFALNYPWRDQWDTARPTSTSPTRRRWGPSSRATAPCPRAPGRRFERGSRRRTWR